MVIEVTKEVIVSPVLRRFMFGTDNMSFEDINDNYLYHMNVLMIFSALVLLEVSKQKKMQASVDELLKSIHKERALTIEIIAYLLVEMQENQENWFVDGEYEVSKFSQIGEVVRSWKKSSVFFFKDVRQLRTMYLYLLDHLSFLKRLNLDDAWRGELDVFTIDLSGYLHLTEDEDYYLYQVEDGVQTYQSFDGKNQYTINS